MMMDIVARLRDPLLSLDPRLLDAADEIERLNDRVDELAEGLRKIVSWSEAYPLDIFPEPDFKKAHEVLRANEMTIDAISASVARHTVEGVGKIARAAMHDAFMAMCAYRDTGNEEEFQDAIDVLGLAAHPPDRSEP